MKNIKTFESIYKNDTEIKKQKFHQYKSPQQFSQTREMIELCCEYFFFFFFFKLGFTPCKAE